MLVTHKNKHTHLLVIFFLNANQHDQVTIIVSHLISQCHRITNIKSIMKEKERMKYPIFGIRIYPCQSINVTAIGIMFLVFIWKAPCGHVPGSLVVECPPLTQVQLKVVNLTLHISTHRDYFYYASQYIFFLSYHTRGRHIIIIMETCFMLNSTLVI